METWIKHWLTCFEDVSALICRLAGNPSDLGYQDHCRNTNKKKVLSMRKDHFTLTNLHKSKRKGAVQSVNEPSAGVLV